ncbi:unnamed protein product [Leptidea sinapis]|uniref:Uncharacterized protein n=1 Tax=Leptidea sinapis TaxID=189913 RepID=A0A5E4QBN1_9NEOP|nr:unnamed protein product [Leptidea sinapis]
MERLEVNNVEVVTSLGKPISMSLAASLSFVFSWTNFGVKILKKTYLLSDELEMIRRTRKKSYSYINNDMYS